MTPIDIMIDLETLGTTPGSVVLSIGAVASEKTGDFYVKIDLRDSLHLGLTVDPDTMSWWRKQSRDAWLASTTGDAGVYPMLSAFTKWLEDLRKGAAEQATGNALRLWGDASSFDLTLLACVYRAAGMPVPWNYREEFDYRTLRTLMGSEKPRSKVQHDGLSDAIAQLVHLQAMLASLRTAGMV